MSWQIFTMCSTFMCYEKVVREPELVIPAPPTDLGHDLTMQAKPVSILERKELVSMSKQVQTLRVCWERDEIREETWESEQQMRVDYPELFKDESRP